MSVASKRRFITNQADYEFFMPAEGDLIGIARASKGNNLHEVEDENGEVYLASMPSKFRKSVWVKRGQFVVLRSIDEGEKVKAEIEHVLDEANVLHIWEQKKWPQRFEEMAVQLTRSAKRGVNGKCDEDGWIDDDMLPPSGDSDEEDEEDEEGSEDEEGEEESDEESVPAAQFNPNRSKAPGNL